MAAITLVGVAVIIFVLLRVVPGDPIAMMISPALRRRTSRRCAPITASTPACRCSSCVWAKDLLHGDFGTSISLHRDVLSILAERLPATLELALAALVFAVLLGGAIGDLCGADGRYSALAHRSTR